MNTKTTLSVVVLSLALVACKDRDDATGYASTDAAVDKDRIEESADRAKESINAQAKAEKARVEAQAEAAKAKAEATEAEAKAEVKAAEKNIDAELKSVFASKDGWADVKADFDKDNGIVTLKGNVPSAADRTEIETKVKTISGVTQVKNELEVKAQ